ncbi:membrane protein [Methylopila jiangsuensis]|uniref:Membrane protein n=1 Tax=Methylopila jiangsuensis TaxID=586230 RepID=A0A9W6N3Q0_9HYPH|nr:DMT family transporter [Methylopila jiangsuensis]MDR6287083.1 drug/metabolite transporter (DMT)-like permease [Methylopila jiangsuensis]GLK76570.1 membrane protein [Methylopila jiangsuensis]
MPAVLLPPVFVLIWSTGFIVAKYAAPHADPLTFLCLRYLGALVLLTPIAFALRAEWPKDRAGWAAALVNGVLLHGVYLGGVWWAIAHGLPAGVSALIAALQPLLTALAAGPLLGERLGPIRWCGIVLGFAGVAAVVAPKLAGVAGVATFGGPIAVNVAAVVALTAATLHQKRTLGDADLRTVAPLQYLGALVVTAPAAFLIEDMRVDWTLETLFALLWSVVVVSIVAVMLMLVMIKRGEVSRVAALIYLVPPTAALQAYALFDETLTPVQIGGMALAAMGVALAARGTAPSAEGCIAAKPLPGEDAAKPSHRPA